MPEEREEQAIWEDPIVKEVRRAREALFAAAGYDLEELCRRLQAEQVSSGREVVTLSPRRTGRETGEAA